MNFRKTKRHGAVVEAASLSDILFFLMLFFLIISTLASPTAIKLLLPQARHTQNIPKQILNVTVNAHLNYFIEKEPVSFEGLERHLARVGSEVNKPSVVLRIDRTIQVNDLVKVVDIVNKNKLQMVIATEKTN
ncbi:ExbD/TolR family protein [Rufibacter psychrotolerans]|uniref:ExbD/TolR family protein n=1 Tax=Rufibacter psychrotolerans TaxID=2812556 RepID=UPI0019671473|nr:biopolymer transporter ExbD [Rufibacter sp. SYSU D00308]